MDREELERLGVEALWAGVVVTGTREAVVRAVLDAVLPAYDAMRDDNALARIWKATADDLAAKLDAAQACQFRDAPGVQHHRPFTERAPICWDCFHTILDELERCPTCANSGRVGSDPCPNDAWHNRVGKEGGS